MNRSGDMFPVDYPDDTGWRRALSLDFTQTEVPPMVEDKDFVYVDLYGNEVGAADPAAQTKFHPTELKALRKGGFFPKPPGAADDAKDEDAPSPVLHSGVGAPDDGDEDGDAKPAARHAKK
jgi:hypothetical protein